MGRPQKERGPAVGRFNHRPISLPGGVVVNAMSHRRCSLLGSQVNVGQRCQHPANRAAIGKKAVYIFAGFVDYPKAANTGVWSAAAGRRESDSVCSVRDGGWPTPAAFPPSISQLQAVKGLFGLAKCPVCATENWGRKMAACSTRPRHS